MKLHYLGQLFLDNNCLLLILKMFTVQEVASTVMSKAESLENKYYSLKLYRRIELIALRLLSALPSVLEASSSKAPWEQYVRQKFPFIMKELATESKRRRSRTNRWLFWRNFFSAINFVWIMQKLSKHRPHGILLFIKCKSSVQFLAFYF